MLESLLRALETLPVPAGYLLDHPHPQKVVASRAGLTTKATSKAILGHVSGCGRCQEALALIDSITVVAKEVIRSCGNGDDTWKNANLN